MKNVPYGPMRWRVPDNNTPERMACLHGQRRPRLLTIHMKMLSWRGSPNHELSPPPPALVCLEPRKPGYLPTLPWFETTKTESMNPLAVV